MTRQQIHVMQNGQIKGVDFSLFGGIDGFLSMTSNGGDGSYAVKLRKIVPWLQKAVTMTSGAVAQLPYYIEDANDEEVDEDTAWGAIRNPQTLIAKVAASLCGGSAYLLADVVSGGIVDLQYLNPTTIQPNFDSNGELIDFTRNGGQHYSTEQIIYFWLPDDTVEVGPAQITPLSNALLPASIMAAMDDSLRQYGERGFIPPTILSAKGMTNKTDIERTEKWWNAFIRGWTKTVAKIINAETMTPQVIGAGMDELRGSYTEISTMQIKNIAAAFGIPVSTFLSDENSYATALSDTKLWYSSSEFVKIYQTIEDTLSDQLFSRFGWNMEYTPEQLEAFQTEETDKTGALQTLTTTIKDNPEAVLIAAEIIGYDLTEEQKQAIEELGQAEEQEPPAEMQTDMNQEVMDMEPPTEAENMQAAELMKWRKFAETPRRRKYDVKHLPPAIAERIQEQLSALDGKSASYLDEVTRIFDGVRLPRVKRHSEESIKALAEAINNAARVLV